MFRHQGKSRTLKHNLRLATALSFVAGTVNVTGFLAINHLTTNVTGHFALFINELANYDVWKGAIYFLYIFSFLLGSFTSSLLIEKFKETKKLNVFVIPTTIESIILIAIPVLNYLGFVKSADVIACMLLFSMGLQNSYVTKISNTVVRTTHLTGLFTDLGIELSQLFFPKSHPDIHKIKSTIKLRLYIICFFFLGGLCGGFLYSRLDMKLNTLIVGAIILMATLFYDNFRHQWLIIRRKRKQKNPLKKHERIYT